MCACAHEPVSYIYGTCLCCLYNLCSISVFISVGKSATKNRVAILGFHKLLSFGFGFWEANAPIQNYKKTPSQAPAPLLGSQSCCGIWCRFQMSQIPTAMKCWVFPVDKLDFHGLGHEKSSQMSCLQGDTHLHHWLQLHHLALRP